MIARPSAPPTALPHALAQPQRGTDWFGPRMRPDLHGSLRRVPPPEHLLPVVQQLLTGATDLTASRQLGLSPRTYSRRVSELLEYLGVESRFQAGVEAARRGWLPHPRGAADSPGASIPVPLPTSVPGVSGSASASVSGSGNRTMPLPRLRPHVMAEPEVGSRSFVQR